MKTPNFPSCHVTVLSVANTPPQKVAQTRNDGDQPTSKYLFK